MAYVVQADVEAYLGRSLTAAELTQLATAADAATALIDRYTGRSWQSLTVTAELHTVLGPTVRLEHRPVSAVSLVRSRAQSIGATWATLTDGEGYELLDAAAGLLVVNGVYDVVTTEMAGHGQILEVTYTVGGGVPAPIKLAAEMLVAGLLASNSAIAVQAGGIQSVRVGALATTYFASSGASGDSGASALPLSVRSLLDAYRTPVLFA